MKKAVLMINLGTPDAPTPKDVGRYLTQFLTDRRVINLPFLRRQALVRLAIVPKRSKISAQTYQELWTDEGSPLLMHTQKSAELLQQELGSDYKVYYAMRYQNPSIAATLAEIAKEPLQELVILPLFPQYASATTGSVFEEVMRHLSKWEVFPNLRWVSNFATHPDWIKALADRAKKIEMGDYDHILMSYHGLPKSQIHQADRFGVCGKPGCCDQQHEKNALCYRAQCVATSRALAEELGVSDENYTICFQSRLGRQEWLKPYASDVLSDLAKKGAKKLLVFSPSFVCDCLETTIEIGEEYKELFLEQGGESLQLVEGLNESPLWISALAAMTRQSPQEAIV